MLVVPWLQDFFALKLVGAEVPWVAVGLAAGAGVLLELAWVTTRRRPPAAPTTDRAPEAPVSRTSRPERAGRR